MRNGQSFAELTNAPEQERLVVGALDEKLQLGVLIRDAERGCRCLPEMHFAASAIEFLSEALSPQLFEPEGELPQGLRVGK